MRIAALKTKGFIRQCANVRLPNEASHTGGEMIQFDPIRLEVFKNLLRGIADEMGVALCRTAISAAPFSTARDT